MEPEAPFEFGDTDPTISGAQKFVRAPDAELQIGFACPNLKTVHMDPEYILSSYAFSR